MRQHMSALTKQQFFLPRTRVTEVICIPPRLTAVVASLLLTMMPLLTGCGGGETGSEASAAQGGATVSLAWSPVQDSSVHGYFVYYGQQSPGQPGSCSYENSMFVDSSSAVLTNLDPNTLYYFTVSAYNGLESSCSHEVSTVTPSASVQTDRPSPFHPPDEMLTRPDVFPDVSRMPGQRPL